MTDRSNNLKELQKLNYTKDKLIGITFNLTEGKKINVGGEEKINKNKNNSGIYSSNINDIDLFDVIDKEHDKKNPVINFKQKNEYTLNFINNLEFGINMHPHGLCVNPFHDGASLTTKFGKDTNNGQQLTIKKFKILNNYMFSVFHAHVHHISNKLLYGDLFIPYIVEDDESEKISRLFVENDNDIFLLMNTVELDKKGKLNSNQLSKFIKSDSGGVRWRNRFIKINNNIVGKFSDVNNNLDAEVNSEIYNNLLNKEQDLYKRIKQIQHKVVKNNLLRIKIVNVESTHRRLNYGFIDKKTKKRLDFWVISQDNGFVYPYKTKFITNTSLERTEILIDLKDYLTIQMITFDFDLNLIGKGEKTLSVYNGNYIQDKFDNLNKDTVVDIKNNKNILKLINKNRTEEFKDFEETFIKIMDIHKCDCLSSDEFVDIDEVLQTIRCIVEKKNRAYFNYPKIQDKNKKKHHCKKNNDKLPNGIRKIIFFDKMKFHADCLVNNNEPTIKFKIQKQTKNKNLPPCTITIKNKDYNLNEVLMATFKKHIKKYPNTKHIDLNVDPVIDLQDFKKYINLFFTGEGINLHYDFSVLTKETKTNLKYKIVQIQLKNKGKEDIEIIGNNIVMQFFGLEYSIQDENDSEKKSKEKVDYNLNAENKRDNSIFEISDDPMKSDDFKKYGYVDPHHDEDLMVKITLTVKPGKTFKGNPFQFGNPYIYNFTTVKDSSEKWIYYNLDDSSKDNHSLYFNLTSGFIDNKDTDVINYHPNNFGSKDVYSIKANTKLSINVKISRYHSEHFNIGYPFHCHYIDRDMGMGGQFYVEKNKKKWE